MCGKHMPPQGSTDKLQDWYFRKIGFIFVERKYQFDQNTMPHNYIHDFVGSAYGNCTIVNGYTHTHMPSHWQRLCVHWMYTVQVSTACKWKPARRLQCTHRSYSECERRRIKYYLRCRDKISSKNNSFPIWNKIYCFVEICNVRIEITWRTATTHNRLNWR